MKTIVPSAQSRSGRPLAIGRGVLAATTTMAVLLSFAVTAPAAAHPRESPYAPPKTQVVPTVKTAVVKPAVVARPPSLPDASDKPAPVWPAQGAATVALATASGSVRAGAAATGVRVGGLPVRVAPPSDRGGRSSASSGTGVAPGRVRVEVLDQRTTADSGVRGVLLRLGRADGATDAAAVDLTVDYRGFRTAYGGDWASRLRLVVLPECALGGQGGRTDQDREGCAGTPLPSHNDPTAATVAATVPLAAGSRAPGAAASTGATSTLVAVSAAPSGPAGSFAATTLQASSTWSGGGNSGSFGWSYPMRVPPAPGGPAPAAGLTYSSQSVDGRHAASNNQPSWVGEGFETTTGGFIERRYEPCAEDMAEDGAPGGNNTEKTGDLCWATDNATLSLGSHSGELIYNSTEKRWHLRSDDGSRIERKTGAENGDDNGEYWVVTTGDGTQYWFGTHRLPGWSANKPVTKSTWTVPVFGNHANEPCHAAAFADSDCMQAWRWNLDYVVDVHGNSASYWYETESNRYARNKKSTDLALYERGGYLTQVDYATRRENGAESVFATPAPARVDFDVADRCLSGCTDHDEAHWPDTPWDQECKSGQDDCRNYSPTFWSTKRLSTVTTQIHSGTGYDNVERWSLTHTFPDPGDGTRAGLWLSKLSHSGLVGGTASVPDIEFSHVQMSNRVDTIDFAAAMNWLRISQIRNEAGGTVSVLYSGEDCVARTRVPTQPASNTLRCYPVRWTPEGYEDPVTDYFHKYVVTTVYEADNTGGVNPKGSPRTVTKYSYLGDPAWHYTDDDGLVEKKDKTWSVWRGYSTVGVTKGDPGEQEYTETTYFRGMHGDRAASGTRDVPISGTGVPTVKDEDAYAGMVRESVTYNGPGGSVVSRQVNEPWRSAPTATRTINGDTVEARFTNSAVVHERVVRDGSRPDRVRTVRHTYDDLGLAVRIDDTGDAAVTGDEKCTENVYEPRNTTAWLLTASHRATVYAVRCADATNPASLTEDDVISDSRTFFDGHAHGVAPTTGLITKTEQASAWQAGSPVYEPVNSSAYDSHGRMTSSWDARGKETKTSYTPAAKGLVTQTVATNPLGHQTTTTVHPAWGVPVAVVDPNGKRTECAFDPLGRVTAVWKPGRSRQTDTANEKYSYLVRATAPSAVGTSTLNSAGNYVTSYTLYDGLLRTRQTQSPSAAGGRLLTDVFYDTAGRKVREYGAYKAAGDPGTTLSTAIDAQDVPNQKRTIYDGAGREIHLIFQPYTSERWRTSTSHGGDHTDVTPPAGGTATSTWTDAEGRTVEIRQFRAATPTGAYDSTRYSFNRKGQLATITDADGNEWRYAYDLRGRQVSLTDPDKGLTQNTFDVAGRMLTATDARGVTLTYQYDDLNRRTAVLQTGVGTRARWTFDTVALGHLTQSVRYVGTASYIRRINSYSETYKPTSETITIPTAETGLGGTYTFDTSYTTDGKVDVQTYPNAADLPLEAVQSVHDEVTGLPKQLKSTYAGVPTSYVSSTEYNAHGNVTQYVLYTGLVSNLGSRVHRYFTHELETGRLTGIRTDRESVSPYTVLDAQYTYDAAGNITKVADVATGDTQCYQYDHLRRITEAWTPAATTCTTALTKGPLGGPAPYWQSWTYYNTGNRRQQVDHATVAGGADRTTTYAYPAAGSSQPHALSSTTTTVGTQTSTASYAYDEAGNLRTRPTAAGAQTLTWDPEGRLATSVDGTGTTTYLYDADGTRLIRRDPAGTTLYLPGQELRYNKATTTTKATRYYTFGDASIASRTAAGLTWTSADHQGTGLVAIDEKTQQATIRRQKPFGEARGSAVAWPNSRGFVNGAADLTGLTQLGARMYDPGIGRFITVDPVQDLADPQQWNGYAYANNSPVTASDPDGLRPLFAGDSPEEDRRILEEQGYRAANENGKWVVKPIKKGNAPAGSWMEYYWNNVRKPPKSGKFSTTYGYGVTDDTLFGSAAVYDKEGNLVASDDNFRSGGGLLPGETGQSHQHLEQRVVRWYEKAGLLKPGYTLRISVHAEGVPACPTICNPMLTKLVERTGIKVLYTAPGHTEVFGAGNSSAHLKGNPVQPKAPLKLKPAPMIPEPQTPSSGGVRPRGGGGNVGKGISGGAGVVGFGADIYFFWRYGPCGVMPIEVPQCNPVSVPMA